MTEVCRHIRINGRRCGSPALRGHTLCYFHRNLGLQHRPPPPALTLADPATPSQPVALDLPPLEDRESIQIAVSMLVRALARNAIEPQRATAILYGLQVASSNANRLVLEPMRSLVVRSTVLDPAGHELAPDEDPPSIPGLDNLLQQLAGGRDPSDPTPDPGREDEYL